MGSNDSQAKGMTKSGTGSPFSEGSNQATFKCKSKTEISLWRRSYIVRYYKALGEIENYLVNWNDFDKKGKPITVNDDRKLFDWKSPLSQDIDKSVITVSLKRRKLFVISIFYSTLTILIQGQKTYEWGELEYRPLSLVISEIIESKSKGISPNVDKHLLNVPANDLIDLQVVEKVEKQEHETPLSDSLIEETDPKTCVVSDTENEVNNNTVNVESKETQIHSETAKHSKGEQVEDPKEKETIKTLTETIVLQTKETENLKSSIHLLEQRQVQNDKKWTEILDICNSVLTKTNMITEIQQEIKSCKSSIQKIENSLRMETKRVHDKSSEICNYITEQVLVNKDCIKVNSEKLDRISHEVKEATHLITKKTRKSDRYC